MARIPRFKSDKEVAQFWDTHSLADFEQELCPLKMGPARRPHQRSLLRHPSAAAGQEARKQRWQRLFSKNLRHLQAKNARASFSTILKDVREAVDHVRRQQK